MYKICSKVIYSEKGDCTTLLINAKYNTPEEAVYMLYMQARWDWLCDN